MSIGFDNPGLLPFTALVALPVLLHFIARPRPRTLKFPSLMLLEKAHRESVRFQRPKHWLLLILRTLWTLMILAVFLQPRWYRQKPMAEAGGSRAVVLIVDASASMRAQEGAQSRYSQAVTESITLLQQLRPGDRANVIRVRAEPESFYASPGSNHDYLMGELRKRPCSREGGELNSALRLGIEQLARSPEKHRELVIISDFQPDADGLPPRLEVPEDLQLTTLPVAAEPLANQAVTALRLLPARPVSGEAFDVLVEVRNFSDSPVQRTLTLQAGERHEQQDVVLGPGQSGLAVFTLELAADHPLPLLASLETDVFPDDDNRYGVLPLRPQLRVGVWGNDATASMWMRSLQALSGVEALRLKSTEVLPADLDAVYLSGWRGESLKVLQRFVESGGSLVFRPDRVSLELAAWLEIPEGPLQISEQEAPRGLRLPDPWPETLALFKDGRFGSPVGAQVLAHAAYPLQDPPLRPILALENGETVWGEFSRHPGVFFWNLSLDPAHSDLVAQAEWIPMFGEGLRHLFRDSETLVLPAGDRLLLNEFSEHAGKAMLMDSLGQEIPTEQVEGGVRAKEALPPGLYRWQGSADPDSALLRAVTLPVSESNLRPTRPQSLQGAPLPELKQAADWQVTHEGQPLWPWLLALAFALAAAEQFFTQRRSRA